MKIFYKTQEKIRDKMAFDKEVTRMKEETRTVLPETELNYFGIAICGAKKKVNKLTGSMALLR